MDVTLKKGPGGFREKRWLRWLFLSAFPREERPPFFLMRLRARRAADWWLIQKDGENAGFFYVLVNEELAYLFFFAVDARFRSQGVGSQALRRLIRLYEGKNFFLAIEPLDPGADNYAMRVRRLGFYQRNGLHPLNQWTREGTVVYTLLGADGQVSGAAYHRLIDAWISAFPFVTVPMEIGEGEGPEPPAG